MPIYEYACRVCGQHFEKLQSFNDEPIRVCPNCAGETRRVLHPVGVIFKGSGWYSTDSRKNTASSSGDNGSKAEGSGSSDSKPESTAPKTDTSTSTSTSSSTASSSSSSSSSTPSTGD